MENSDSSPRRPGPRQGRRWNPLSPARASVLNRLRDQPEPVTIASLVALTHLHENTVREHLNGLVHRGLVRRERAEPDGRGRPVWLYSETGADQESPEYPGLVATMSSEIATASPTPLRDAAATGHEWGSTLVRDRGWVQALGPEARDKVVELFDDLGFAPETNEAVPATVRLTRCPLLEAAFRDTDVVCQVHLGIVRGALAELGAESADIALTPFAEPGACLLHVP